MSDTAGEVRIRRGILDGTGSTGLHEAPSSEIGPSIAVVQIDVATSPALSNERKSQIMGFTSLVEYGWQEHAGRGGLH
jgi:hypothetical protein